MRRRAGTEHRQTDRNRSIAARRHALQSIGGLVAIALSSAALAAGLLTSQQRAEVALEDRYATRVSLAAAAVSTYAEQLMDSEQRASEANLTLGTDRFGIVVSSFGFSAAVLLDSRGNVLEVHPAKPALIGTQIGAKYAHLTAALAGSRAISPVVPAAATGEPVVGFAVPFSTPSGRRVLSGAYAVSDTPLHQYLRAMVSLRTSRFFLVDDRHRVVASSVSGAVVDTLHAAEPALDRAYGSHGGGHYGDEFFSSAPVAGTTWAVVGAVSMRDLLAPVNGPSRLVPWLVLAMLIASTGWVWLLMRRRAAGSARLHEAFAELDRVSRQDGLTGTHTRRSTGERLAEAHARSRQAGGTPLSVLMVDVDHFKRINDTFGHLAGDDALITVASRLQAGLRHGDILGRWGGEEFLIVLPDTEATVAGVIAERLRDAVASSPISLGSGGDAITVTVSVGISSSPDAIPEVLVYAADKAMYTAKSEGRNRVRTLNPPPVTSPRDIVVAGHARV